MPPPGGRKLGRPTEHRLLMLRNLVTQLIQHERIETTVHKAKELRKLADRVVTLGKEGTESARRRAMGIIFGKEQVDKLFGDLASRYKDRAGGYTRILQTRRRQGDAAQMAFIEYIDRPGELRQAAPPNSAAQQAVEWAKQWRAGFARGGLNGIPQFAPKPKAPKAGAAGGAAAPAAGASAGAGGGAKAAAAPAAPPS